MSLETYRYQSDYAKRLIAQGRADGEASGEAKSVLACLDARGIKVPAGVRDRITACADPEKLLTWVRRAATITSTDELFD